MTRRQPCPAAPGPLEEYAARFDDLVGTGRTWWSSTRSMVTMVIRFLSSSRAASAKHGAAHSAVPGRGRPAEGSGLTEVGLWQPLGKSCERTRRGGLPPDASRRQHSSQDSRHARTRSRLRRGSSERHQRRIASLAGSGASPHQAPGVRNSPIRCAHIGRCCARRSLLPTTADEIPQQGQMIVPAPPVGCVIAVRVSGTRWRVVEHDQL